MADLMRIGPQIFNMDHVYAAQAVPLEHSGAIKEIRVYLDCHDPADSVPLIFDHGQTGDLATAWQSLKGLANLLKLQWWLLRGGAICQIDNLPLSNADDPPDARVTMRVKDWRAFTLNIDAESARDILASEKVINLREKRSAGGQRSK